MNAMAYTELALSLLLNDEFEESIPLSIEVRDVLEKTPLFLNGDYWPHIAIFHHAWCLIGLGKANDAYGMVFDTLRWREKKYGASDPEPFK
jgi:hypothetical protein